MYAEEIAQLRQKEKELGIEPDWEVDAFMKASALQGKQQSILTDYVLRTLGLEVPARLLSDELASKLNNCSYIVSAEGSVLQVCEDTIIGDQLVRGISGGQKKRVTTGAVCPPQVALQY